MRDLSDSSLIMRLTRGRGWIAVLCALLGGIVALNVISLSLNADAGRLGLQIDRLETQNSALRAEVAERLSASRVETAATTLGLANPDPEEISYLSAKDGDARKLARLLSTGELLTEPSQPSSYPSAGESYGLAPSSPTTDTTTTTPAPSPAPSPPPPSTGTSSERTRLGTAPSAPSSGTTEAWALGGRRMRGIDRRLGLLFCVFLLIFSFAIARAFWLQGVRGGALRAEAHGQQVTEVTIPGQRGRILDRNGKVLAASEDAADVIATPYQVKNPAQAAMDLHEVLGMPTTDLLEPLQDRGSGFAYLARKVGADEAARVEKLNIAGISTVPTSRRFYPQGELASQVIGAVGSENQGLTGLEEAQNEVLGGANGEQDVIHDALGRPIRMDTVTPASVGEDIQITLDAAIQARTEEALATAGEHFEAQGPRRS